MRRTLALTALLALPVVGTAAAIAAQAPGAEFPAIQTHLDAAARLAGDDLAYVYQFRCRVPGAGPEGATSSAATTAAPAPTKVLDNLYFVGGPSVMGWALETSEGIIIFDALNNGEEVDEYMFTGLRQVGLDPGDIRYVVVMHGHGDHFGGAKHIKEQTGARIVMSAEDWDYMASRTDGPPGWTELIPARDVEVTDGQVLTLGNTQVTLYVTPGHTPGTLSAVFETSDRGEPHVVGFWGGTGFPRDDEALDQYFASLSRFVELVDQAGVDVLIANHLHSDNSRVHLETLRLNPDGPSPYVIGEAVVARYFGVLNECARAQELMRQIN